MINEANDHPRYAVDVQRDQSKPGHPHATVASILYTVRGKKQVLRDGKTEKRAADSPCTPTGKGKSPHPLPKGGRFPCIPTGDGGIPTTRFKTILHLARRQSHTSPGDDKSSRKRSNLAERVSTSTGDSAGTFGRSLPCRRKSPSRSGRSTIAARTTICGGTCRSCRLSPPAQCTTRT